MTFMMLNVMRDLNLKASEKEQVLENHGHV